MTRSDLGMFWKENQYRAELSNAFSEEIRRMEKYDEEVCPEEWRAAVKHVKEKGINLVEIIQKFGDREFYYPKSVLESLANAYNEVQKSARFFPQDSSMAFNLPIQTQKFDSNTLAKLVAEKDIITTPYYQKIFRMNDKLKGFKSIFATYVQYESSEVLSNFTSNIFGLPDESQGGDECEAFSLGSLTLKGLKSISERRFTYSLGLSTVSDSDIAEEFAKLYNLPVKKSTGRNGGDLVTVGYRLEEVQTGIKKVMPKNVLPVFNALESARKQGLFSKVSLFEVKSNDLQLPKKYYLAVGVDHFNNKYPWAYIPSENDLE